MASKNKPCNVCGNPNTKVWSLVKDYEYFSSEDDYTYHKCESCNSIFLDHFPTDKLHIIYPKTYYSFSHQKQTLAIRVKDYLDKQMFKKALRKFNQSPINVLDVGSGSGWMLNSIKAVYPNISFSQVVDIDITAKSEALQNGHDFFHGTIEDFETSKKFDLILMFNLIEHISNPQSTLNKLGEILNDNGKILIKTPNIESLDAKYFRTSYWGGLHAPRHWILFSAKSFKVMLQNTPFTITRLKYTQGAPFWTWSILASLHRKGLLKLSSKNLMINNPLTPLFTIAFAAFDFLRLKFGFKTSQMFIELEKHHAQRI